MQKQYISLLKFVTSYKNTIFRNFVLTNTKICSIIELFPRNKEKIKQKQIVLLNNIVSQKTRNVKNLDKNFMKEGEIMPLSNNLVHYREKIGITQEQLAEDVGISRTMIAHYEMGIKVPNIITGVMIAKRLGITVETLVSEKTSPQSQT